ncbi:MAG: aspartate kinase [Candidatus Altiarchaeota archaeon]|nr:aspartate kinase [Candidatus Altiarchaeota archaeon]
MIVMKFGGTSVGSAKEIKRVVELVSNEKGDRVVVVSAMSGVTNSLLAAANKVIELPSGVVEKEVNKFHKEMLDKHVSTAEEVIADKKVLGEVREEIEKLAEELKVALLGVGYLEELSPKSLDYVVSFGERFSILLVSGALNAAGIKAKALTGHEAGIVTDSNFGRARPLHSTMENSVRERGGPVVAEGIVAVVAGFIAADKDANTTTMGRGGSDYTASLLGRCLSAKEVQIWTDVDGILSTDPKIVPEARLIKTLSYVEAMDLAYFGAKVIHSKMIAPAMDADIPVRIKNTFNPGSEGTLIVREQEKIETVIKAVAVHRNVDIVNLKGIGMAETPNIAGKVFTLLGDENINIIMISGSSESNLSFVLERKDVPKAVERLNERFLGNGVRNIDLMEGVCIITIVGVGMHGAKGIAARVFQAVSDEDVNIIMIAQGSSEVNISFIVEEKDGDRVVKALHKKFIEG